MNYLQLEHLVNIIIFLSVVGTVIIFIILYMNLEIYALGYKIDMINNTSSNIFNNTFYEILDINLIDNNSTLQYIQ
jgi:hypothetical protein